MTRHQDDDYWRCFCGYLNRAGNGHCQRCGMKKGTDPSLHRPGDLHPRTAAHQLGLTVPSGQITWAQLLDAAIDAYWQHRPTPDPRALTRWRRQQQRRRLTPQQWLRRAGAA